jgi:autotransporter-associated beta strand protein
MVVDSGVLNVGGGGGAVMIGGGAGTAQSGKGSLVINGGTVNVGAAGTTAQGVDASKLWLNGYGLGGSSARIDLNGGMLSTARTIENGSIPSVSSVVNLNGGTLQAAGAIDLIAAVTTPGFVRRTTVNVLSGGAIIDTQSFNASISEILRDGGGGGGLTKAGLGTLTLTGINTYTGNTTVNAGTLLITSASLADASTVTIANSAMLNLNFDETGGEVSDTVANLIIGTTPMAAGVYGATGSGATTIDDTHFSGVGTLTVTSGGGGGSPYDTWATGSESFNGDANGDGVQDGLAFLLGAATPGTNATGLLPTVSKNGTGLVMTFDCLSAANRGTAVLDLQHSGDLGLNDAWAAALVPGTEPLTVTVSGVDFVTTANGALIHVVATIPSSGNDLAGKLFGRLKANETP